MATVHEGLLRFGNWIIMYDLGAAAISRLYGNHRNAYQDITGILTQYGFVRIQCSVFRHPTGCLLWQACLVVHRISRLYWAAGNSNGDPHIIEIRVAIQRNPAMIMTAFARGGPFPNL